MTHMRRNSLKGLFYLIHVGGKHLPRKISHDPHEEELTEGNIPSDPRGKNIYCGRYPMAHMRKNNH